VSDRNKLLAQERQFDAPGRSLFSAGFPSFPPRNWSPLRARPSLFSVRLRPPHLCFQDRRVRRKNSKPEVKHDQQT
jgi:hypothetical protein